MKLEQAKKIIKDSKKASTGFRVHFETYSGYKYKGDYFPDNDEAPLKTESEAWKLASDFAKADKTAINVYVVDIKFRPVEGYKEKVLNKEW